MTPFGIIYLVAGLANGLATIRTPSIGGRAATFRIAFQFAYLCLPVIYHAAFNDPYVILGLVTVPLSGGYVYMRSKHFGLAALALALAALWVLWSLLLFLHRATEWTFLIFLLPAIVLWGARTISAATERDEKNNLNDII